MKGWKYYNHALVPTCAPHEEPDIEQISDIRNWKNFGQGTPFFARWTTDFDCGREMGWWYIIKDGRFCEEDLPAKSRKHIRHSSKPRYNK